MNLSTKSATKFLLVISILVATLALNGPKNFVTVKNEIIVTSLKCINDDPTLLTIDWCELKPIRRNVKLVNIKVSFVPVVNNTIVHFRSWKRANGFRPFPVNVKLDKCKYLAGARNPVFDWFYDAFRPYTNVNHTCPYSGYVAVEKMPVNSISLPSVFPGGDYRVDFMVIYNGKLVLTIQVYASIKEN